MYSLGPCLTTRCIGAISVADDPRTWKADSNTVQLSRFWVIGDTNATDY